METPILKIWTQDLGDDYATVQDAARTADDVEEAILYPPFIRLSRTTDVTPSSTGHAFQIGPDDGVNLAMDGNEIMGRNAGNVNELNLNIDGGIVRIGGPTSDVIIRGRMVGTNYSYSDAAGSVAGTAFPSGPGGEVRSVSVTFPVGRFTATPIVQVSLQTNVPQNRSVGVSDLSATGMTINQYSDTSTRSSIHWTATQMTATTGAG